MVYNLLTYLFQRPFMSFDQKLTAHSTGSVSTPVSRPKLTNQYINKKKRKKRKLW